MCRHGELARPYWRAAVKVLEGTRQTPKVLVGTVDTRRSYSVYLAQLNRCVNIGQDYQSSRVFHTTRHMLPCQRRLHKYIATSLRAGRASVSSIVPPLLHVRRELCLRAGAPEVQLCSQLEDCETRTFTQRHTYTSASILQRFACKSFNDYQDRQVIRFGYLKGDL